MLVTDRDCGDREENSANNPAVGPNEECEVEDGPDEEESADVDFHADVVFGGIAPLANEPRGNEQKRKGLLSLIAQAESSPKRGDGPHENGCRPVFLDVEDLSDKGDGCAGGDGANRVERRGEGLELLASDRAARVKDCHHGHHQQVAHAGAELVPVCGDEKAHAAGQEDAAENERDAALPGYPGNRVLSPCMLRCVRRDCARALRRFPSADASRGIGIENAGGLPAV